MKLLEKLGIESKEWKDVRIIQDPREMEGFEGERGEEIESSGHSKKEVIESLQRKAYLMGVQRVGIKYVCSHPGMPDRLRSHDRYYGKGII